MPKKKVVETSEQAEQELMDDQTTEQAVSEAAEAELEDLSAPPEERGTAEMLSSTWQALSAARRQSIVLEGKVYSIDREYRPYGHNQNIAEAMVNVFVTGVYQEPLLSSAIRRQAQAAAPGADALISQHIMVSIPFSTEFYQLLPLDMSDLDLDTDEGRRVYIRRQEQMARKFLGQTIPFCITHMERDTGDGDGYDGNVSYAIAGSRKKALPILMRRVFEPRRGMPFIKEGDNVDAKIISVGAHSVQVTCGGIDSIVKSFNLTYRYIDDFRKSYYNGQVISLKVRHIQQARDGSYQMVLSGRDVELEAAKARASKVVKLGSLVHGTFVQISNLRENGRCTAIAWLNDVELPAFVNAFAPRALGDIPITGDEANLVVTGFHDNGLVITNCSGTLGSPARLQRQQF